MTKRYIDDGFWGKAWVAKLPGHVRYLYVYLCTHPQMTRAGALQAIPPRMAVETGLSEDQVVDALQRLEPKVYWDRASDWIAVHGWARFQCGSPKWEVASLADLEHLPGRVRAYLERPERQGEPTDSLPIAYAEPTDSLSTGQYRAGQGSTEQDRTDISHPTGAPPQPAAAEPFELVQVELVPVKGKTGPDNCPHQAIIELYHEVLPMCPRVRVWDGSRKDLLRNRWREDRARQDLEWWREYFELVAESRFLTGRTRPTGDRRVFLADLEWLIRHSNMGKVANGRYHKGEKPDLLTETNRLLDEMEQRKLEEGDEGGIPWPEMDQ